MICDKYKSLTDFEQSLFLAKLIHSVINDDNNFVIAEELVQLGIMKGLFDNVKFGNEEIASTTPLTTTIEASDTYSTLNTEK